MSFRRWLRALFAQRRVCRSGKTRLQPRFESLESRLAPVGDFSYALQFGAAGSTVQANAVVVDGSGNVYIAGSYTNDATFPASGGTTLTAKGNSDAFVAKFDSAGAKVWVQSLGSSGNDVANAIALDNNGDIIVAGSFSGSNFTAATTPPAAPAYSGGTDIFVAKLQNSNGAAAWLKGFGGAGNDSGLGVAADSSGNIVVSGFIIDGVTFGATPTIGDTNNGSQDGFVAKLATDGTPTWAFSVGGTSVDAVNRVKVDASGNVYVAGSFSTSASFDPNNRPSTTPGTGVDAFLARYSSSGTFAWVKGFGGSSNDAANDLALDSSGNPIVIGTFGNFVAPTTPATTVTTNSNTFDAVVAKFNAAGQMTWVTPLGSDDLDAGLAVAVDASGAIYATGSFRGAGMPGGQFANLNAGGSDDAFIALLTSAGSLQWTRQIQGGGTSQGNRIATDGSSGILTVGSFTGTADFDPDTPVVNKSPAGSRDGFLLRLTAGAATTPDVSVAATNATVAEDGTGKITYTFTRTGSTAAALSVNFSVSGTATFGTDYTQSGASSFTSTSGVVVIPIGSSTASVVIDATDDATVEADESVVLAVTSGTGYSPTGSAANGSLANDDSATVNIVGSTVAESAGTMTFTVSLSNPVDVPVSVTFDTLTTGTATVASDFAALLAQSVTFAANDNANRTSPSRSRTIADWKGRKRSPPKSPPSPSRVGPRSRSEPPPLKVPSRTTNPRPCRSPSPQLERGRHDDHPPRHADDRLHRQRNDRPGPHPRGPRVRCGDRHGLGLQRFRLRFPHGFDVRRRRRLVVHAECRRRRARRSGPRSERNPRPHARPTNRRHRRPRLPGLAHLAHAHHPRRRRRQPNLRHALRG
ncbi:MAG: SBBP repeat-containing protein [Gemmataceae bacterium]